LQDSESLDFISGVPSFQMKQTMKSALQALSAWMIAHTSFNVGSWLVQQPFDFGAECVGPCCYMFSGQVRLSGFQHAQVYHLQGFFVKNSFTISFRRLSFWPLSMPVSLI
jgi:hypothetical protein